MNGDIRQHAIERFTDACARDERVVAAFLGGSFAKGTHDAYSDLDLYVVTSDDGYESFFAAREGFLGRIGKPVFLEDRNDFGFDMVLFMFQDGVRGELALGRQSHFLHLHGGPYRTLVDKIGLLQGVEFPYYRVPEDEQRAIVRALICGFWRDVFLLERVMNYEG